MFQIGDEIRHNTWGLGKILAKRHGGYEVFVNFENGANTWAKSTECVPIGGFQDTGGEVVIGPGGDTGPIGVKDEQKLMNLQALESFKLGIVPPFVKKFIFGRDKEIEYFNNWLSSDTVNHEIIFGNYGTGKTHFLNYLKEMAEEHNYAVSLCSIDPTEAPLYKPKYVYNKIVQNISFNDGRNFDDFIDGIREKRSMIKKSYRNKYILEIFLEHQNEENFKRWIKGDNLVKTYDGFPTLQNFSTSANVFCNLLSFYSYCFKKAFGLNGLVILFDEAESMELPAYPYQKRGTINFFRGLRMTVEKDQDLFNEPKTSRSPKTGALTGLIYNARNPVDFLYNDESALKVVYAFTPAESIIRICEKAGYTQPIILDELTVRDREEAINAIQEIYCESYNLNPDRVTLRLIKEGILENYDQNIRAIVKQTIEALDVLRHYGDKVVRNLVS